MLLRHATSQCCFSPYLYPLFTLHPGADIFLDYTLWWEPWAQRCCALCLGHTAEWDERRCEQRLFSSVWQWPCIGVPHPWHRMPNIKKEQVTVSTRGEKHLGSDSQMRGAVQCAVQAPRASGGSDIWAVDSWVVIHGEQWDGEKSSTEPKSAGPPRAHRHPGHFWNQEESTGEI